MPSTTTPSSANPSAHMPAAHHPPRPSNEVLAETEQQWVFSEEDLDRTPSILDGMKPEEERHLRGKGITFIGQVGVMLKLPQVTISTAAVYFNRFLMRNTLVQKPGAKALHHYQIAAVCLFLATKVEETCRKTKELVVACCRVAQKNPNLLVDEQTRDFWKWRDTILHYEDQLLESICFDLTVEAPHRILFEMLKYYNVDKNKRLRNAAWGFINDSNLTPLCVLFTSRTIAASALFCGAKQCEVEFPDEEGKPWWEVQHVTIRDIRKACNYMAGLYEHVPGKDGPDSIYVGLRTPEDGDIDFAKTRLKTLKLSQTPISPGEATAMNVDPSIQSQKRPREDESESHKAGVNGSAAPTKENGDSANLGKPNEESETKEPEMKKAKHEVASIAEGTPQESNGPAVARSEVAQEDVSEEGEVEE